MGPGAPGFARVSSMNSTGKLALAHATRKYKREGSLERLLPPWITPTCPRERVMAWTGGYRAPVESESDLVSVVS